MDSVGFPKKLTNLGKQSGRHIPEEFESSMALVKTQYTNIWNAVTILKVEMINNMDIQ